MLNSSDNSEFRSIFRLRCLECDGQSELSRLWLRTSIQVQARGTLQVHHYVECMNCRTRLRSRQPDHMERVDEAEWVRFVGDSKGPVSHLPSGMHRLA